METTSQGTSSRRTSCSDPLLPEDMQLDQRQPLTKFTRMTFPFGRTSYVIQSSRPQSPRPLRPEQRWEKFQRKCAAQKIIEEQKLQTQPLTSMGWQNSSFPNLCGSLSPSISQTKGKDINTILSSTSLKNHSQIACLLFDDQTITKTHSITSAFSLVSPTNTDRTSSSNNNSNNNNNTFLTHNTWMSRQKSRSQHMGNSARQVKTPRAGDVMFPSKQEFTILQDVEMIEYSSAPIIVKNAFKNNPKCPHNLIASKSVGGGIGKQNVTAIDIKSRAMPELDHFNIIVPGGPQQSPRSSSSSKTVRNQLSKLTPRGDGKIAVAAMTARQHRILTKPEIHEHFRDIFKIKGNTDIFYHQSNQSTTPMSVISSKGRQIKLLPHFARSLDTMNSFSMAKHNLAKYARTLKL